MLPLQMVIMLYLDNSFYVVGSICLVLRYHNDVATFEDRPQIEEIILPEFKFQLTASGRPRRLLFWGLNAFGSSCYDIRKLLWRSDSNKYIQMNHLPANPTLAHLLAKL